MRVENVGLHGRQLLRDVGDDGLARLEAQRGPQPLVGMGVDAGDAGAAEVERDPVRLAVVEGGADAVAGGGHGHGQ